MGRKAREMDEMGRVQCPTCKEWKHLNEFYTNKNTKLGVSHDCKPCHKAYMKRYSKNRRDDERKYTLREAAAILQLQDYDPEHVGPDDEPADLELPDDVKWINGRPHKVRPLTQKEFDDLTRRPDPRPSAPHVGKPIQDSSTLRKFQDQLKTYSDSKLREAVSTIGAEWNEPEKNWSIWQNAVAVEVRVRGWDKREDPAPPTTD